MSDVQMARRSPTRVERALSAGQRVLLVFAAAGLAFIAAHCVVAGGFAYLLFAAFFLALGAVALRLAMRERPWGSGL